MKWIGFACLVIVICVVGLFGCSDTPVRSLTEGDRVIIEKAEIAQVVLDNPRSIRFTETVNGFNWVWLAETPDGDGWVVHTQFYSKDGCTIGGPPIIPGTAIKVAGIVDADFRLVAETIWLLEIETGLDDCEGPPAE